jgi:hypothetical protein
VFRGAQEEEQRMRMPHTVRGHALERDDTMQRKCMIFERKNRLICVCVRAICGSTGGVTCWAWHLEAVVAGTAADGPVQWQRAKRQRHGWPHIDALRYESVLSRWVHVLYRCEHVKSWCCAVPLECPCQRFAPVCTTQHRQHCPTAQTAPMAACFTTLCIKSHEVYNC